MHSETLKFNLVMFIRLEKNSVILGSSVTKKNEHVVHLPRDLFKDAVCKSDYTASDGRMFVELGRT